MRVSIVLRTAAAGFVAFAAILATGKMTHTLSAVADDGIVPFKIQVPDAVLEDLTSAFRR
jgi:hypothetical protein